MIEAQLSPNLDTKDELVVSHYSNGYILFTFEIKEYIDLIFEGGLIIW